MERYIVRDVIHPNDEFAVNKRTVYRIYDTRTREFSMSYFTTWESCNEAVQAKNATWRSKAPIVTRKAKKTKVTS